MAPVAERDPFGRLRNEDPLEFLGRRSNGTEPVDEAVAGAAAPEPRADGGEPRAHSSLDPARVAGIARRVVKVFIAIGVLALVGGVVAALMFAAHSATMRGPVVHVERAVEAPPVGPNAVRGAIPPAAASGAATPTGLQARSMLLRRNLAPALRRLAASGLGRLRTLSIRPERFDAQLLTRGGRLRSVQGVAGRLTTFATSGPGLGRLDTIAFARVDAAAPGRLARGAAERLHVPTSHVDYVALVGSGSALTWSVVLRGGAQFLADAHGRITRRIG